jgi:4-oxalocrotonate tautomerase
MPLVRISLRAGKPAAYRRAVADAVHQAMMETINVAPTSRFQIITEHAPEDLIYDPTHLGIQRTDDVVFIQITLAAGRTPDQKRALYKRMAELLTEKVGMRPQDVFINLLDAPRENWSLGNGEAQLFQP